MLLLFANLGWGQVKPAAEGGGADNGLYGLFSNARPNYGDQWLVGGTAGGYLQWNRFVGIDGRVTALRWGPSSFHQYYGVIGPRVALNRGHITLYGAGEGGIAHARTADDSEYAGTWLLTAGLDYQIRPRIKLRLGEFGYGRIYVLEHGLNPKAVSAGVVVKLF